MLNTRGLLMAPRAKDEGTLPGLGEPGLAKQEHGALDSGRPEAAAAANLPRAASSVPAGRTLSASSVLGKGTLPLGSAYPGLGQDVQQMMEVPPSVAPPTPRLVGLVTPFVAGRHAASDVGLDQISGSRAPGAEPALPAAPAPRVIFREAALQAKVNELPPESLPTIGNGRWAILGFLISAATLGAAALYFGKVEVTAVAPGAIVIQGGPRPVVSQVSGPVAELLAATGDHVTAGQPLARIDAAELEARKERSAAQLALITRENERLDAESSRLFQGVVAALKQKRALLAARASLKRQSRDARALQATNIGTLASEGAISQAEAVSARELQTAASEELLVIQQQIADIDLELSDREKAFTEQRRSRSREVEETRTALTEAESLIALTTLRAPVAGKVESLLVTRGQVVQSGGVFARIVPDGAATSVVVFAPVRDASFLSPGLAAQVEFASLPVSEFGKAPATVSRVSQDVASSDEVTQVLGGSSNEAQIRVELALSQGEQLQRLEPRLRSGERVIARINTRKRRLITLVFDFLRKWYPT